MKRRIQKSKWVEQDAKRKYIKDDPIKRVMGKNGKKRNEYLSSEWKKGFEDVH